MDQDSRLFRCQFPNQDRGATRQRARDRRIRLRPARRRASMDFHRIQVQQRLAENRCVRIQQHQPPHILSRYRQRLRVKAAQQHHGDRRKLLRRNVRHLFPLHPRFYQENSAPCLCQMDHSPQPDH